MGGSRTIMSDYMRDFKERTGYMSLKEEYSLAQARRQNKYEQSTNLDQPADVDSWVTDEEDTDEEVTVGVPAFIPPIQRRDDEIKALKTKVIA